MVVPYENINFRMQYKNKSREDGDTIGIKYLKIIYKIKFNSNLYLFSIFIVLKLFARGPLDGELGNGSITIIKALASSFLIIIIISSSSIMAISYWPCLTFICGWQKKCADVERL